MISPHRRLGPARSAVRTTPAGRPRGVVALLSALSVVSLGLAACSDEMPPSGGPPPTIPTQSSPNEDLDVPAHPLVLVDGSVVDGKPTFTQAGTGDVTVSTASLDGGEVQVSTGADKVAGGPSLQFPPFVRDPQVDYPRSVVVVRNAGTSDQFNPGGGRLVFGVDFNLDARSTGRDDDNGNNLIQRGLSSDDALYKLEVDANMRPACTVRGTQGTVVLRSTFPVVAGAWYRVRCTRDADKLEIEVGKVLQDGSVLPNTQSEPGPIGVVTMSEASIPISIGGKVAHNGGMVNSASDQFNGLLRNPFVVLPD